MHAPVVLTEPNKSPAGLSSNDHLNEGKASSSEHVGTNPNPAMMQANANGATPKLSLLEQMINSMKLEAETHKHEAAQHKLQLEAEKQETAAKMAMLEGASIATTDSITLLQRDFANYRSGAAEASR